MATFKLERIDGPTPGGALTLRCGINGLEVVGNSLDSHDAWILYATLSDFRERMERNASAFGDDTLRDIPGAETPHDVFVQ